MTVEVIRSGIDLSYVDAGARPQDDLFGHVNGRWLADHRMPADRATDGAFRLLADRAEEQVRDIITDAAAANAAQGTDPQGTDFSLAGGKREESNDEEEHDLPVVRP